MAEQPNAGGTKQFDFTRLLAEMKLPGMPDIQALTEANRRNMEALTAANRVAVEGAQAVARRHMEIMQQAMTEMTEGVKTLSAEGAPRAKAAKQAELVKQGYQRAVNNMQELSDLIQRSNAEALNLLNRRFSEAMDELKQLAQKEAEETEPSPTGSSQKPMARKKG
ncbi:MAG: TIGR01841 family phasin [Acetobacteraceae bacterium]